MKNEEDEFSVSKFRKGYGQFPYIVIRVVSGIYMQIPIHFVPEGEKGDATEQPGTHVTDVPKDYFQLTKQEQIKKLHPSLLEKTLWVRDKISKEHGANFDYCLVEGPERCFYYFREGHFKESDSIPSGGTLIDQQRKFLAMNRPHFIDPNEQYQKAEV
jgi:hypothetical protein